MGTGKKTAPSLIRVSDISETSVCPLARKMRAELKKRGVNELTVIWSPEQPAPARDSVQSSDGKKFIPSGAVVPAVAGLYLAVSYTHLDVYKRQIIEMTSERLSA